jgi:Flp pilus assembly protein TadG
MLRFFARLVNDTRGLVFAETAISLSVLSFTILAGLEVGRYVLLTQKLDRAVSSVADITAQGTSVSVADLDNVFAAATEIIKPFSFSGTGTVIISSVSATGANPPVVDWQRAGGGSISIGSVIGIAGGNATLPADITVRSGEEVIVSEIYYNFTPWLAPQVAPATQLYHRAFYRPRQGPLTTLLP